MHLPSRHCCLRHRLRPRAASTRSGNPAGFSSRIDNPWFPLRPGTTYVYVGQKDGQPSRDVMTVTHQTSAIDGAPCVVIQDRLYLRGRLHERTTDWYTQDRLGNVWYFGESTAELDRSGHVTSTAGSWRAGVRGARPGIYMPAHPRIGESMRQEYFKGQAEDHFQVLSLDASVKVAYVSSRHALLTKEWTPLEPGVLDHKLYVRGVGMVLEQAIKGGTERAFLVALH
jgi:hypothetical protein